MYLTLQRTSLICWWSLHDLYKMSTGTFVIVYGVQTIAIIRVSSRSDLWLWIEGCGGAAENVWFACRIRVMLKRIRVMLKMMMFHNENRASQTSYRSTPPLLIVQFYILLFDIFFTRMITRGSSNGIVISKEYHHFFS